MCPVQECDRYGKPLWRKLVMKWTSHLITVPYEWLHIAKTQLVDGCRRSQPQQDPRPMVGLQGACKVDGIPVACWQWARGAAGPAPIAHGSVSPGHIYSLPVTQLSVPQPELNVSIQAIHEHMEQDEEYLRVYCGYTLITMWEWECLKRTNPRTVGAAGWENALNVSWPLDRCLQHKHKDWVFCLYRADIHTLQGLKDEFLDLLPTFKTTTCSRQDASPHMAEYYQAAGVMSSWRFALHSS